jgi:hypothetical protein
MNFFYLNQEALMLLAQIFIVLLESTTVPADTCCAGRLHADGAALCLCAGGAAWKAAARHRQWSKRTADHASRRQGDDFFSAVKYRRGFW